MSEYDAFALVTNSLDQAKAGALIIAQHRPDQRKQWEKLAETLEVTRQAMFHLAGDGIVGRKN